MKTQSSLADIERTMEWGRNQGIETETVGVRIARELAHSIEGILSIIFRDFSSLPAARRPLQSAYPPIKPCPWD